MFFAQKTPDFGLNNRLRIWGVPPPPPVYEKKKSVKRGLRILGGNPPPPFTDKIRKVVFDTFPKFYLQKNTFYLEKN